MAKAKGQMTEIEALKSEVVELRARVEKLEAGGSSPTHRTGIMTPEDLRYTLRVHGTEAFLKANKERNRQIREVLKQGRIAEMKGGRQHGKGSL